MRKTIFALFYLAAAVQVSLAQYEPIQTPGWFNRYSRWSVGLHGGGNMWINDFNTTDISGGAGLTLRYALTRTFSLGIMAGYDALQSKNERIQPGHFALRNVYVEDKGFSGNLVGWFHFSKGKSISPYVYLGLGSVSYKRTVQGDLGWPSRETFTSIHIPVGLGLEVAASHVATISLELGASGLDRWSDNYTTGRSNLLGTDWFPRARVGVNLYFGTSDDDDDDGGGLTNGYERYIGTDLHKTDSDGDGLRDFDEVTKYLTNAGKTDSDRDGVNDGDEIMKYDTDPLLEDTDDDSLNDGEEIFTQRTNPLKSDSDGDVLKDGEEVLTLRTNPLKSDTDGDGLQDKDEVVTHRTDPRKDDTDGDTVGDALEIANHTDPRDPGDDVPGGKVMEVGTSIVFEGIVFKSGQSTIEPGSGPTLAEAFQVLVDNPNVAVEVRGHTDNVGTIASNNALSRRRAGAVRSWLVKKGVDSRRIRVAGFGPANPIADNSTPEGRMRNRRIEFFRIR